MSEVQGRPAGTMSMERRYGIAISVALILGGVYWALTGLTEDTKTSRDSYAVQGGAVTVESGSADVELRSGDVREITVDRKYDRNLFGSAPSETYKDGTLKIRDTGCGFLSFGCDTHYLITVPKDVKVTMDSSSGDLHVSDLPGGADLETTSGSIEAHRIGGDLSVKSSSGSLDAEQLTASKVTTESSSGSANLSFVSAPTTVQAETSSGDLAVEIPVDTQTYKVDIDTSSGDESANVKIDPASTRSITAKTSSGDVTIEYAG